MKSLFDANVAEPVRWKSPETPAELRAAMRRGWETMKRETLDPPRRQVLYVSPHTFEEWVQDGICDREGNFL